MCREPVGVTVSSGTFTGSYFGIPGSVFIRGDIGDNFFRGFRRVENRGNYETPVAATDQRSQIKTFNIAPSWTRALNPNAVFTLGGFVRRDQYHYYPSDNPFADLGPIQQETVAQHRTLTNAGLRSDLSYVKGIHNVKVGATYQQTFLNENDRLGVVDNGFLPSLNDANGNPADLHLRQPGGFRQAAEGKGQRRTPADGPGSIRPRRQWIVSKDFVGNQGQFTLGTQLDQPGAVGRAQHGSGGIVRAHDENRARARAHRRVHARSVDRPGAVEEVADLFWWGRIHRGRAPR